MTLRRELDFYDSRIVRGSRQDCWFWKGAKTPDGHGLFSPSKHFTRAVHRVMYEQVIGEVPRELVLHHKCRMADCVNPYHLEPLTHQEHRDAHRKTHCKEGHDLSITGVKRYDNNGVRCSICRKKYVKAWRRKQNGR